MSLNNMSLRFLNLLLICIFFTACALNNDADIEFTRTEQNLMMECYLTPGNNFEMRLMETNSFNEDLVLQLVWNADVIVYSKDKKRRLLNILNSNNNTNYVFNYGVSELVSDDSSEEYSISIITEKGKHLTANTHVVEFIPIKEVTEDKNEIKVSFNIPINPKEKYFSIIAEGEDDKEDRLIIEDFDASLWTDDEVIVSLRGDFYNWKTLKIKLQHITSDYYVFKKSTDDAYSANIDPFTVPTKVVSNVNGGIGIFTYFTIDSLVLR